MTSYLSFGSSLSSAPDPYRPDVPQSTLDMLTSNERHKWVSEAAYFIAERRGFAPGYELSDWLAAESEVNRLSGRLAPRASIHPETTRKAR